MWVMCMNNVSCTVSKFSLFIWSPHNALLVIRNPMSTDFLLSNLCMLAQTSVILCLVSTMISMYQYLGILQKVLKSLRLIVIYLKNIAMWLYHYNGRGIQAEANGKGVWTAFNNVCVKGKRVWECIKVDQSRFFSDATKRGLYTWSHAHAQGICIAKQTKNNAEAQSTYNSKGTTRAKGKVT